MVEEGIKMENDLIHIVYPIVFDIKVLFAATEWPDGSDL